MTTSLESLAPCFQGVLPAVLATCSRDGEPNVTYVSQIHLVDAEHVALSCQFFNKTRRNLEENPHVSAWLHDPRDFEAWRLDLRFERAETSGPLFDAMAARIEVIASHTGMKGIFRLRSADVCRVLALEPVPAFLVPAPVGTSAPGEEPIPGPLTELRALQCLTARIASAASLDALLSDALLALEETFGFAHSMLFVPDESGERMVALATRGYPAGGIGGEAAFGDGLVGTVAAQRRMVRLAGVGAELRYGRAIRDQVARHGGSARLLPEIPLPGLADAQAQLGLPLLAGERLVGVLAVESRDPLAFDEWDEAYLQIVASQVAGAMERVTADDDAPLPTLDERAPEPCPDAPSTRTFVYYRNDDCIFVDGEYLIRNVPAKILRKLLSEHAANGRIEFTNRELRLDPSLGLPVYRDNLESRLILLRRRLEAKCPEVRIVPIRRGRFALDLRAEPLLVERDTA